VPGFFRKPRRGQNEPALCATGTIGFLSTPVLANTMLVI